MIAAIICLLLGMAIGHLRSVVLDQRQGRRYRERMIDLECALLDKGAQVAYLKEHVDGLGAAVNRNAEIIMQQDARINRLLDALRVQNNTNAEQATLLRIAQQQTRRLPMSDFLYPSPN